MIKLKTVLPTAALALSALTMTSSCCCKKNNMCATQEKRTCKYIQSKQANDTFKRGQDETKNHIYRSLLVGAFCAVCGVAAVAAQRQTDD